MKTIFFLTCFLTGLMAYSQNLKAQEKGIYIGTDPKKTGHRKALVEFESDDQGILIPRLTEVQKNNMFSKSDSSATGMLIYQKDKEQGFYYYDGKEWEKMGLESWTMGGNTIPSWREASIGTKNNYSLIIKTNNQKLFRFNTDGSLGFSTANLIITLEDSVQKLSSVIIGTSRSKNTGTNLTFVGANAGKYNTTGFYNTNLGYGAGSFNTAGGRNTNVGAWAGTKNHGSNNVAIGYSAGYENEKGSGNVFLGNQAGDNNNGSGNVFLGNEAGAKTQGSNLLIIANTNTENPLIWGDFKNAKLQIGGNLLIKGNLSEINGVKYFFTAAQGKAHTFLQNDGKGNLTWANPSTSGSFWALGGNNLNEFATAYIGTNTPNDLVFKVDSVERMRLDQKGVLHLDNEGDIKIEAFGNQTFPSIYIGKRSGQMTNKDDRSNVAVGHNALSENHNGGGNVVIGNDAGQFNTVSESNVLIGKQAGMNNQGDRNVMIGNQAGKDEKNLNDALIIANNNETALLRGSFVKDSTFISVNGILVIGNNKVEKPTTNGALKYENNLFWGSIKGKWQPFLLDSSLFVKRDGKSPLTGDWKVGKGFEDVDFLKVLNDINAGGFITADKGIRTTLLQLKDDYTAEFITIKINSASQHNEIPSSKAVVDFVSSLMNLNINSNNSLIFSSIAQDYLRQDGTTPLKGDWNVGNKGINNIGDLQSNGIIRSPQLNTQNLFLNGHMINTISTTISANPNHEQLPTAQAVFEFFNANNAFMSSYFVSANQNYVKIDGSTPLTSNWNVGNFGLSNVSFVSANFVTANFISANTLQLQHGVAVNFISTSINSLASDSQIPTNKAVFEFVSSQINFVSANQNFVKTDGSTPLTNNWNVGNFGLSNVSFVTANFVTVNFMSANTLQLQNGAAVNFISTSINSLASDSQIPTNKAVYEFVSSQINFVSANQNFVKTEGSTPLTNNWNVGNFGLSNVSFVTVNFVTANFISANNLQLQNGVAVNFISTSINSLASDSQIPTNKAVYEFVSSQINFVSANQNFVKTDGSTPLTGNWNVGMGFQSVAFVSVHGNAHLNGFTSVNQLHTHTLQFANGFYSVNMITAQISSSSTNSQLPTTKGVFDFVSSTLYMVSANPNAILLNGNTFGTVMVIGTNDNQNFEIRTNNQTMFSIDNNNNNIVVGQNNFISTGIQHSVITGGNLNFISGGNLTSGYSTIGGGEENTLLGWDSTISGGVKNIISGNLATIGGGAFNELIADWATIGGGWGNSTYGVVSTIAGGYSNVVSGDWATIGGGDSNEVSGTHATIGGGFSNTASGGNSVISGGNKNTVDGLSSAIGGGEDNTAWGNYATISGGIGLKANSYAECVVGMYNKDETPTSSTTPDKGDQLFVVGNGTSDTDRSDAFKVYKNGNTFISGNAFISGSLQVQSLTTGFVSVSGGVLVDSDERYKNNIKPLEKPLEKIQQINGYTYDYKTAEFADKNFPETPQIGVIAQEVEAVFPELVATDANGYKSVDYAKFAPILIEGIKAQQKQIEAQNQEIQLLKQQLKNQDEKIQKIMDLLQK